MKKLLFAGMTLALTLAVVVPAYASVGPWFPPMPQPSTDIHNWASVKNVTFTVANTGANAISAYKEVEGGRITTGAATAVSTVDNAVNGVKVGCPTCTGDLKISNGAKVFNFTGTLANTGLNKISAFEVECGRITTGPATAGSVVTNAINQVITGN